MTDNKEIKKIDSSEEEVPKCKQLGCNNDVYIDHDHCKGCYNELQGSGYKVTPAMINFAMNTANYDSGDFFELFTTTDRVAHDNYYDLCLKNNCLGSYLSNPLLFILLNEAGSCLKYAFQFIDSCGDRCYDVLNKYHKVKLELAKYKEEFAWKLDTNLKALEEDHAQELMAIKEEIALHIVNAAEEQPQLYDKNGNKSLYATSGTHQMAYKYEWFASKRHFKSHTSMTFNKPSNHLEEKYGVVEALTKCIPPGGKPQDVVMRCKYCLCPISEVQEERQTPES